MNHFESCGRCHSHPCRCPENVDASAASMYVRKDLLPKVLELARARLRLDVVNRELDELRARLAAIDAALLQRDSIQESLQRLITVARRVTTSTEGAYSGKLSVDSDALCDLECLINRLDGDE